MCVVDGVCAHICGVCTCVYMVNEHMWYIVYVYVCVWYVVHTYMCRCIHMQRPEENIRCLPLSCSTYFETRFLTECELPQSTLAGMLLSIPHHLGSKHAWPCLVFHEC